MPKLFQPEKTVLSNGIPVILQHYDGPVAANYWWVNTGSADENPSEAGFAHFLEHMLFKDAAAKETGRASTGQMAQAIESLGGDINAYTSFDQTVYHVTCAATHWERVLDAFGTIAKPQRFLKQDFEREREVILEELRKNEDSPGRMLFQDLFSLTYRKHPYGRPVIGFTKTLKAAKVKNLEAFYRRKYLSGNMGLVIVGPLEGASSRKKSILKLLEKRFGSAVIPSRESKIEKRVFEPALRTTCGFRTKPFDVKTPSLSVSFRSPDLMHPDTPALDLMASILGMGELSRLYQRLFYKTSVVVDVSGGLYVPRDPGMLYFQAELSEMSKIGAAASELLSEIRRISEDGPTSEELQRVLVNAESERLYATQTADGIAGRLGFLGYVIQDLEFDQKYLAELRSVDASRVREVAREYLDFRRMSGVVMVPKEEKGYDTGEILALAEKVLVPVAPHPSGKKKLESTLPVEYFNLNSGTQVVFSRRPNSQVFSVHASLLGGVRLELSCPIENAEKDWGSSQMMALTWNKGCERSGTAMDSRAIAAVVEGSASELEGFSGRNSIGLHLTGLARDWENLTELLNSVLISPTFPEDEVTHSRRVTEDSIRSIEEHSSQLCTKLFLEALFDSHPYGKIILGSPESVKSINSSKLKSYHRAWIRPERLVISVSGPIKRAALDFWLTHLESLFQRHISAVPALDIPTHLADELDLKAPRWVEKNLGREQSHIIVGGLGTRIFSEDRHAIRLLQTILGGQSGRLFIELREKKSLAYTVAPMSFEGIERGYIGTYIACAPSKKDEAIAGIRSVLEQLAQKGPMATEMARAKEFFLGRRAMDLQSDSAIASHYGLDLLYGVTHMKEEELIRKIRSITAREIKQVCLKYLVEQNMVTSAVG